MKKVLQKVGKYLIASASLGMILSAAVVTVFPCLTHASYRIAANVTLRTSATAVPGKSVFQTCITTPGDTQWAYYLYLPATYDPNGTKKWPMLIFQEVAGAMYDGNGGTISNMFDSARGGMNGGPVYDLERTPKPAYLADRFIVLAPFIKSDMILYARGGVPGRMMGLYKDIISRFKVDTTHISMMGNCAGSAVCWMVAAAYPKFPSALALFCFNDNWCSTIDLTKACNLKDIPYQHYADQTDPMVPFAAQTAIRDAITGCGGTKMQFIVQNKGQHESWGLSGLDTVKSMYDFLLGQATPVAPRISEKQKLNVTLGTFSSTDQIEVVGLNGQILLKARGDVSKMGRSLPNIDNGVHVIRVTHADHSVDRVMLSKLQ